MLEREATGVVSRLPVVWRHRLRFGLQLMSRRIAGADRRCPYCRSRETRALHRRCLILEVRQCADCGLMFRFPKAERGAANQYYQGDYDDFERGLVTKLPEPEQARIMVSEGFANTPWDARERLDLVVKIAGHGRLLDYGCSWGYLVAQAQRRGFQARGFEISRPRAQFGRAMMGADILDDPLALASLPDACVDVIYTSHVLEHLPDLEGVFPLFRRLLASRGVMLIFVPNCGGVQARRFGLRWGPFANQAHTLCFDAGFFERNLGKEGFSVSCRSDPYEHVGVVDQSPPAAAAGCDGDELLVVARVLHGES